MQKIARPTIDPEAFDSLIAEGFIRQSDLIKAIQESLTGTSDLETLLIDKYRIPKSELGKALGGFFACAYVPFDDRSVADPELLKDLSYDYLKKYNWIPFKRQGQIIDVLIDNPHDLEKGHDIRRAFPGLTIRFSVSLRRDIERYLMVAAGETDMGSITDTLGELRLEARSERDADNEGTGVNENDSAIVRLANQIIVEAYRKEASDIHIEPYSDRKETSVRFRIDGTCSTYMRVPATYRRALVSRIKIMASLDISERRKPQDGKIRFKLGDDRPLELRVATLPTAGGNEDVALRLLSAKESLPLEAMEFSPDMLRSLLKLAEKPHGLILCVGPTGSGKTTTLHAILRSLNTDERKIWTAEDPIEITQDGLRQVQIHPKIGFTFASAMRSFLRADPDVIMIGEMRDKETADVAIEASLTGHLVLSTLHTNSAVETVTRLLDMGCDSFNFADSMLCIIAKRLCKRLCSMCKQSYHPPQSEYDELAATYGQQEWETLGISYDETFLLSRQQGCAACNHSGFKGRVPLHELFCNTEELKNMIQGRAKTTEIQRAAIKAGMVTLLQDGVRKVLSGTTTLKQVRAVAMK
ncbi:putative Type IV pilus assembly protein PilB [Nitrospira sp. KM1]|uniref:GspE/PulE family protein n=1 Tax=Nitrospira sp. KM1 TaxID=1936990 RepID=UPI0013A79381|nr:GspE/PulE family protein [Nitrospira sp. KM1]BCA55201.1 putative Type IV pilus assembly protein PilB [Nitrospira sp. KM1]